VTFSGSAASPEQFPRDGLPEVAFLGRSNVGKSSLLNALAGVRGLARVSSDPGRTRAVNFFRVEGTEKPGGRGRGDLYLVDLPGYGYAKASREVRESFERIAVSYLSGREPLRLCVFIVDARHETTERDETLRAFLSHHGLPFVVAANKVDALSRGEAARRLGDLARGVGRGAAAVLGVSAERGEGTEALWNTIRGAAFAPRGRGAAEPARQGHDGH
jgi:GTP-binding protein